MSYWSQIKPATSQLSRAGLCSISRRNRERVGGGTREVEETPAKSNRATSFQDQQLPSCPVIGWDAARPAYQSAPPRWRPLNRTSLHKFRRGGLGRLNNNLEVKCCLTVIYHRVAKAYPVILLPSTLPCIYIPPRSVLYWFHYRTWFALIWHTGLSADPSMMISTLWPWVYFTHVGIIVESSSVKG